ncbi:MAG: cadherin-like domain-containing protein [Rivularia sp. (in: cyanobacteria)]
MTNTFSFQPETTFEVIDGGFDGDFDGIGDSVFPGNFFTVILGSSGEAAEFAEFNLSEFTIPQRKTITSARFDVKITGLEVGGLGAPFGDNPDSIGVFGYAGNGVADASDFEAGVLLDTEDTSNPFVGQQLSFDVTDFVQNLVNNDEDFAGIGLRALEFGGLLIDPPSISMPTLIIETAATSNNIPVATDDVVRASQNTPVIIPVAKLLGNDTDLDGDYLTITAVNNAMGGTVTLNDNGTIDDSSDDTIIFTPNQDNDNTNFEYTLSVKRSSTEGNRQGGIDTGLVAVTVFNNIDGTNGNDNLEGTDKNDIISGFEGNDFLYGGNGKNQLYGGIGNDGILGGKNQDTLVGGKGNDFLNGGKGADILIGGRGADNFYLDGNSSTKDIIIDFNLGEGDRITTFNNLLFKDLSFSGSDILFRDIVLATLQGFDTASLDSTHFYAI